MSELKVGDWFDYANGNTSYFRKISRIENDKVYDDKFMHKKSRELYTDSDPIGLSLTSVRKLTKIELILYGLDNETK